MDCDLGFRGISVGVPSEWIPAGRTGLRCDRRALGVAMLKTRELAALLSPLHRGLRFAFSWYIGHRHRRRVQQGADYGFELVLGDFGNFGHGTIVRLQRSRSYTSVTFSIPA